MTIYHFCIVKDIVRCYNNWSIEVRFFLTGFVKKFSNSHAEPEKRNELKSV